VNLSVIQGQVDRFLNPSPVDHREIWISIAAFAPVAIFDLSTRDHPMFPAACLARKRQGRPTERHPGPS